jgi:ABC-type transporter Mla subunit MlaD
VEKRSIMNVLGSGLVLLLLTSCASVPPSITVSTKPIEKPSLIVPPVDTVTMKEVKWIIVTEDNLEEVIADLKASGQPLAIFGLSGQGYENLSTNFSAIRALVQQQQTIIAAYKQYYEKSNEALDSANKRIESTQDEINEQQQKNNNSESVLDKLNPFK